MANTQTTVPLFVANQVLTAAQQNTSAGTGVPVFATTVTRDAAFGGSNKALAEGQLCYIEASNIVQYYDGAAWATVGPSTAGGLVPVTPTSIAATGGSSSLSGATATFTGTSTISLNGIFTATYNAYRIVIEALPSGGSTLRGRLRAAGTDNSSANYGYAAPQISYSAGTLTANAYGTADALIVFGQFGTQNTSALFLDIAGAYSSSKRTNWSSRMSSNGYTDICGGQMTVSTSYDGITFYGDSVTFTGTVTAYGYSL